MCPRCARSFFISCSSYSSRAWSDSQETKNAPAGGILCPTPPDAVQRIRLNEPHYHQSFDALPTPQNSVSLGFDGSAHSAHIGRIPIFCSGRPSFCPKCQGETICRHVLDGQKAGPA